MGTKRARAEEDTSTIRGVTGTFQLPPNVSSVDGEKDNSRKTDTGSDQEIRGILREFSARCDQVFAGTHEDASEDVDRIIPKVASVRKLVEGRFGHFWGEDWMNLAVGALVCFRDRQCDVGLRERVQMLYVIDGGTHLRAHNGQVFTYADGSWNAYEGLISEGTMARCSTYLLRLEGLFRTIAARSEIKREEEDLIDAIASALTNHGGPGGSFPERALHYFEELSIEFGDSKGAGATWIERTAKGVSNLKTDLMRELVDRKTQLFAYYGEWCAVPLTQQPGISFTDTCVIFTENDTGALQVVRKTPSNNIYVHIGYPLLDPVEARHVERLETFWCTTFWGNIPAMKCQLAALTLALRGENVDRCFWTIGPGGVGQSLMSHFLDTLLGGRHSFLDTNVYYSDEELRKQAQLLASKIVVTAQEAVQGASHRMREDLYKKHMTADAIASRLPYAILTKQVELRGWKRMELNRLPTFSSVTEVTFDSILRRGWVCKLKARFKSAQALDGVANPAARGVFLKDPSLKAFLKSGSAIGAGLKMIAGFMNGNSKQQCEDAIDNYVERDDGGLTRECLRRACDLPPLQEVVETTPEFDPLGDSNERLEQLNGALVGIVLQIDGEATKTFLLGGTCANAFREWSKKRRVEMLDQLVQKGFWVELPGSRRILVPTVETTDTVGKLFPPTLSNVDEAFPERINVRKLRNYVNNPNRKANFRVQSHFLQRRIEAAGRPSGLRGNLKTAARYDIEASQSKARKILSHENSAEGLLQLVRQYVPDANGNVTVHNKYRYLQDVRTRRYLTQECVGAQKISRRLRAAVLENVEDWDLENAHFAIAAQFPGRVCFKVNHPISQLPGITAYVNSREEVLEGVGCNREEAKKLLLKTLNGARVPADMAEIGILRQIQQESKFLRWAARTLQPSLYEACCNAKEKTWPEASTLTYTFEGVEDFILEALHTYIRTLGRVNHLSLEFDGVEADSETIEKDSKFGEHAEEFIYKRTGYRVKLRRKDRGNLLGLLREKSSDVIPVPTPPELLVDGNCIANAVAHVQNRQAEISEKVRADGRNAPKVEHQTYRDAAYEYTFGIRSREIPTLQREAPGNTFLLHVETEEGCPHCVAIEIGEGEVVYVFDGSVRYKTTRDLLNSCILTAVDRTEIVLFELGRGAQPADDVLLDLRAGATDRTTSYLYKEDPGDTPSNEFLETLRTEVRKYVRHLTRSTKDIKDTECKLCPKRSFVERRRLVKHVKSHHVERKRYCPSGYKQIHVAQALFDNDRIQRGGGVAVTGGNYLLRSAEFMKKYTQSIPGRWTDLDKMVTLVLDSNGPHFRANVDIQSGDALRRVGNTLYTRSFAESVFSTSLTHEAVVERVAAHFCAVAQEKGEVASLLPRNTATWENVIEDVFFSPSSNAELDRLIGECVVSGEYTSLSVDGTFKPCLGLLGQAKHTARKSVGTNQALPADAALHVVYTIRGRTGAVLGVHPCVSESTETQVAALATRCSAQALRSVQHYAADNPSRKLLLGLRRVCPNLKALSLDPLHIVMKYEQASYERKSAGSKFLRKIVSKFSGHTDKRISYAYQGTAYYDGAGALKIDPAEKRAIHLLTNRCMTKREAEKLRSDLDVEKPFTCRAEFVLLLAALVAIWPDEVEKITMSGKPIFRSLVHIAEPDRIEWLLNGTRFRLRCSTEVVEMLAVGTTSNESLHMELRRWFGGIHELHQSTLMLKLRIFQLAKLIAHNCALYHQTTIQIKQRFVLARSAQCKRLWTGVNEWEKWCSELRRRTEEKVYSSAQTRQIEARADYRKKHLYRANNPLSRKRKQLKAAVKKHRSKKAMDAAKTVRRRLKRTAFCMDKGRGVRNVRGFRR